MQSDHRNWCLYFANKDTLHKESLCIGMDMGDWYGTIYDVYQFLQNTAETQLPVQTIGLGKKPIIQYGSQK